MNSFSFETVFNSSLVDAVKVYYTDLSAQLLDLVFFHTETQRKNFLETVESLPEAFHFDEFQWKLFTVFTAILFLNLIFIFIAWQIFGKRICDKFMKPGEC